MVMLDGIALEDDEEGWNKGMEWHRGPRPAWTELGYYLLRINDCMLHGMDYMAGFGSIECELSSVALNWAV